jgi:hypothetical protein
MVKNWRKLRKAKTVKIIKQYGPTNNTILKKREEKNIPPTRFKEESDTNQHRLLDTSCAPPSLSRALSEKFA